MNVLISVDMEGISGVVQTDHVSSTHKEYNRFRRLMTAEANAAVEGALAGGATQVVVNDSHGGMANILIEDLHPAAELISGSPKPFSMMQGIGPEVDAVFFVGYHGASGTAAATLEHTWTGCVVEACLSGQMVGETGLNAALAGSFDAPVVLVTGDRAVTEEAQALLGEIDRRPLPAPRGSTGAHPPGRRACAETHRSAIRRGATYHAARRLPTRQPGRHGHAGTRKPTGKRSYRRMDRRGHAGGVQGLAGDDDTGRSGLTVQPQRDLGVSKRGRNDRPIH
jgi:D-aminopeptidase